MDDRELDRMIGDMKKKKRKKILLFSLLGGVLFLALIFFLFLYPTLFPQTPPETGEGPEETDTFPEEAEKTVEDDEMRGVYIASVQNINFPSKPGLGEEALKAELDEIVTVARTTGFDTLFFQVRPTADALYQSSLFPTSAFLVEHQGDKIDFDPLAYIIEKAAEFEMEVVAWINPYRVTNTAQETKEDALSTLAETNPARQNPDWTVFFDGKLYFNPAHPSVRDLIQQGVKEVLQGYGVAGVLFDDYFYPYPVKGEVFDDAALYQASSSVLSLDDWRRENVNTLIRNCYETVKAQGENLTFGVSPFGIWQNAASHPGGSETRGMEAYSAIYCDALAWIEGEYVDYIAPQIYWERGNSAADFATLTRWWSAQVDGTSVKLYISHAAYKVGQFELGAEELLNQITYSRSFMGVSGNVMYGFADIVNNTSGLRRALTDFYRDPYREDLPETGVEGISFHYPKNGGTTTLAAQFVSIASDPRYPVYSTNGKIGRTKSGLISVSMPLSFGENNLKLIQNGKEYLFTLTRVEEKKKPATLPSPGIHAISPVDEEGILLSAGESLPVSVTAPAGCSVSARLGDRVVTLTPTIRPQGEGEMLKEVYTGAIPAPDTIPGEEMVLWGDVTFICETVGQVFTATGPRVELIPDGMTVLATVTRDYTHLKVSTTSSFYDDHTPASVGMCDRVLAAYDGYVKLSFGGFVARENINLSYEKNAPKSRLIEIRSSMINGESDYALTLSAAPPLDLTVQENKVMITLYGSTTSILGDVTLCKGERVFEKAAVRQNQNKVFLDFYLIDPDNYYGFDYSYDAGAVHLKFRQPQSLGKNAAPLEGKVIVVDAGHGGSESGAAGFFPGLGEKEMNLKVALALAEDLKALGARVVLTRQDDSTVTLYQRMDLLTETDPDLAISIHHNSVNENKKPNAARGTWGLTWSPSGFSLSEKVQQSATRALSFYDFGWQTQKLAVCRNHRFPQTLLEVGFICTPAEYQVALRSDYSQTVSRSIVEGVLDWYRMQEEFSKE